AVLLHDKDGKFHIEVLRLFATKLSDSNRQVLACKPSSDLRNPFANGGTTKHHNIGFENLNINSNIALDDQQLFNRRRVAGIPGYGSIAQYSEVIHVPPLPPSGLLGRQKLIHVEYAIVLRLRMVNDKRGKNDLRVNIPITIGTEPTQETSFNLGTLEKICPCYASFDYSTGEIKEHDAKSQKERQCTEDGGHRYRYESRVAPAYKYYRCVMEKSASILLMPQTSLNTSKKPMRQVLKKNFSSEYPTQSDNTAQSPKQRKNSESLRSKNPMFYLNQDEESIRKISQKSLDKIHNPNRFGSTLAKPSYESSGSSTDYEDQVFGGSDSSCHLHADVEDPLSPMSFTSSESLQEDFKRPADGNGYFSEHDSCSSCSTPPPRMARDENAGLLASSASSIRYIKSDTDYTHGKWALQYLNKASRNQLARSNQLPRSNAIDAEQSPGTVEDDSEMDFGSI
ncbi:hypothetical protein Ciccas_007988, partial [Cichlidogyrus casuarinus]